MRSGKQVYHLMRGYLAGEYTPKKFCDAFRKLFSPELRSAELSEQEYAELERLSAVIEHLSASGIKTPWTEAEADALRSVIEKTLQRLREIGGGLPLGHDEMVARARELAAELSVKELARDFLYGVAHNAPEYRTALASYYYIKNLPEHELEKVYIGRSANGDIYDSRFCEICSYHDRRAESDAELFRATETHLAWFYKRAEVPLYFRLNLAQEFLEEYREQPRPTVDPSDYEHFKKIMAVIEAAPENTTAGKLPEILKNSGMLNMTMDQLKAFVDMLGYLNILHPSDCFGVTEAHIRQRDQKDPLNLRSYAAYPVNRWTRKCGIDYASISALFDGIYD